MAVSSPPRSRSPLAIAGISACLGLLGFAGLPTADPAELGMDKDVLSGINTSVSAALQAGKLPGCVVAVGYRGKLVWLKAYGHREVGVPMDTRTCFDLASLTKPIATACSVMQLVESGEIGLDTPLVTYLPGFVGPGKSTVTVRQLLTHTTGLAPANNLRDFADGPEAAMRKMLAAPLRNKPGTYAYSDIGFMILGHLVETRSESGLDERVRKHLFEPLGMKETGFRPAPGLAARCAPTQKRKGAWMRGEVHDPRAWGLGGVAGHAGLFSTAGDLAVFAQMLLNQGQFNGVRVLRPATVATMTRGEVVRKKDQRKRALGWDAGPGSSNRSPLYSKRAFGHGGFTGTGLWIDPTHDLFVIFLSNRVHPDGKGSVNPLIGEIGTIAIRSLPP